MTGLQQNEKTCTIIFVRGIHHYFFNKTGNQGKEEMCVWAGCIGKKPCAPRLADTLEEIEGIWAGYYTGIATVNAGKLHYAKCAGCVSEWRKRFHVEDLPGCTGLIHSRTNSGGGDNRAHPYMAAHGKVAVVAQGSLRCFTHLRGKYIEFGNTLVDGRIFNSSEPDCDSWKIRLKDGQTPSLSDIVSNAIEREYEKTGDPVASMRKIGSEILEEAATMVLFNDRPGEIGFINMNQRIVYNFTDEGAFLSITPLALPGGYGAEIPGNTVGIITADSIKMEPLSNTLVISPFMPGNCCRSVIDYLKKNPGALLAFICNEAIAPLFSNEGLEYQAVAAYRTLENLLNNGYIRFVEEESRGCVGQKGRIFRYSLIDDENNLTTST